MKIKRKSVKIELLQEICTMMADWKGRSHADKKTEISKMIIAYRQDQMKIEHFNILSLVIAGLGYRDVVKDIDAVFYEELNDFLISREAAL